MKIKLLLRLMKRLTAFSILAIIFAVSCDTDDYASNKVNIGYTPIYMDSIEFIKQFKTVGPMEDFDSTYLRLQPIYQGHYLMLEVGSGINLIDVNSMKSVGFINAPYIQNFYLGGKGLTCNLNLAQIFLDIKDFPQITFDTLEYNETVNGWANFGDIKSKENANNFRFRKKKVFFECPQRQKGLVLEWEELNGENLKCFNRF